MSNCTIRQTENNFLRWTRVYGTFSIQDMQAAGGIPAGCNPADVSPIINLTATSGVSEVTLNWTNTSSSQTGVYVYRSTSSGFTPNASNLLATLGDVETYSDTSATPGTLYYYVVVGFNDEGESTPSNEASGQILNYMGLTIDPDGTGTSGNTEFTLPLTNDAATSNVDVYNADTGALIASGVTTASPTVDFGSSANINIAIVGTLGGWKFNNGGDCLKVLEWSRNGIFSNIGGVSNPYAAAWYGCANMEYTATDALILRDSMSQFFRGCTSLTASSSGINSWDVSAVTNMGQLFFQCTNFNANINSWNVSSVTDMNNAFFSCSSYNQPMNLWDVSGTNLGAIFYNATSFNQDISGWDVSGNTNGTWMFRGATAFNQDISGWNVSNFTQLRGMFQDATAFNQDISGWNVAKVTNFNDFLRNATAFNQDLSNWDNDLATGRAGGTPTMSNCFNNCGINTANYDALLISWDSVDLVNSVTIGVNGLVYTKASSAAETARQNIITNDLWSFVGDSPSP